jgi:hypothetical protein
MTAHLAKRKRHQLGVEPLETRALLSASTAKLPIAVADAIPATPPTITAELARKSDPNGDGVVLHPTATIVGQTEPGARVRLEQTTGGQVRGTMKADAQGKYHFVVRLPVGRADFRVECVDPAGRTATMDLAMARGDVLIDWNATALDAIRAGKTNPPLAARNLAMIQLAVYDAVNSIDPRYQPYGGIQVRAPGGASMVAAVAGAADEVLNALYPKQTAAFDATLAESLATVPDGVARIRGERLGRRVGDAILALRANDGSDKFVAAPTATRPGMWSRTPPAFGPPVGLNFAFVTPFAMTSPSQFRPGPPPALNSAEYTAAYDEVKSVGGTDSTTRTPDQTAFARFWSDLPGLTFTPPGHWNQIAEDAAMSRRLTLPAEARLFALLDIALADAGISCWETKDFYDFWRPVTAIRAGDSDGNPLTVGDPSWTPLWATPAFSSYTSGHATFSAAAAAVLDSVCGANFAFTDAGDPTEGLAPRHFAGFDQAAAEAAASRMYGGIHFRFDNETGLGVGGAVGQYVLGHELLPRREK